MEKLKRFFAAKGLTTCFLAASVLCTVVALAVYAAAGSNQFVPDLSGGVIACLIVALIVGALSLVLEVKMVKYVVYLLGFSAWLLYLTSQINYITNVFVAIDGTRFSAAFVVITAFGALAWICALVSAILQREDLVPLQREEAHL